MPCTHPTCPDHNPDEFHISYMESGAYYEPDSNFEEQERDKCTAPDEEEPCKS